MADASLLMTQCRSTFAPIPAMLVRLLQTTARSKDASAQMFSLEHGLEFWKSNTIGDNICTKIETWCYSIAQGDRIAIGTKLKGCAQNLKKCDKYLKKAESKRVWEDTNAAKMTESWRLFCFLVKDITQLLQMEDLDMTHLVGDLTSVPLPRVETSVASESNSGEGGSPSRSMSSWNSIFTFEERARQRRPSPSARPRLNLPAQNPEPAPPYSIPVPGLATSPRTPGRALTVRSKPPEYPLDSGFPSPPEKPSNPIPTRPYVYDPAPIAQYKQIPPPNHDGNQFWVNTMNMNFFQGPPPPIPWVPPPYWSGGPPPPPAGPPISYKSSQYSLRETVLKGIMDLMKPEMMCMHGERHIGTHMPCFCCGQNGCWPR